MGEPRPPPWRCLAEPCVPTQLRNIQLSGSGTFSTLLCLSYLNQLSIVAPAW